MASVSRIIGALTIAAGAAVTATASAHHSFAVFFDEARPISIEGKVTAFRFTNPHGTVTLDVAGADGTVTSWRVETNAPVVLQRRGWTRASMRPGESVRIDGWQSRDGRPYMRLRRAFSADGKQIGQAFGTGDN